MATCSCTPLTNTGTRAATRKPAARAWCKHHDTGFLDGDKDTALRAFEAMRKPAAKKPAAKPEA
jgi:hypothetical protein